MPKNCSADLLRISEHVDKVLESKNQSEIYRLKDMFGLAEVVHDDDFASYGPMRVHVLDERIVANRRST